MVPSPRVVKGSGVLIVYRLGPESGFLRTSVSSPRSSGIVSQWKTSSSGSKIFDFPFHLPFFHLQYSLTNLGLNIKLRKR